MTDTGGTNMGDLFNQRRAAAAAKAKQSPPSKQQKAAASSPSSSGGRPPSLLDIQAEQESDRSSRDQGRSRSGGYQERSRSGGYQERSRSGGGYSDRGSSGSFRNERRGGRGSRSRDYSDLPLEQGCIRSLKDSFGFIYCADRPDELFFHYSEVSGCHAADLEIDDEVEFRVGTARNDDKMKAFAVKRLEPGTIEWYVEEDEPDARFQGLVERPVRSERGSSQMSEGTIRMLVADEDEDATEEEVAAAATGPLVRFTASDYEPAEKEDTREYRRFDSSTSNSSRSGRLGRNDLVEFSMVTERRTGNKLARSITLLQSERERQRLTKEKELLANATLEQGVVTSLKSDYGFLRSNRRREEVYFHYSNVALPEDHDDDDDDESELVLKEGQDMEFLVVTEGGDGRKEKLSAREVKFLPKGTVMFHKVIAEGVTGVITRPPHPADAGYSSDMVGRVRLSDPISDKLEDDTTNVIDEVLFYSADAPGGSYAANRDGSSVGLWVREGDTLLFDVVKDVVDSTFRVAPTRHLLPVKDETCPEVVEEDEASDESAKSKAVRLVAASLAGRTEGVIHAIKEGYGFISCAERPVDTYFRLYEVFPDPLQKDLRRSMHCAECKDPLELKVGTQVQFDLSLQGMVQTTSSRSRSRHGSSHGNSMHERENLKAQRLLFLPPKTFLESKVIAKDAKGIVAKEDPKQTYAGLIEFEKTYKPMTPEERHPLVAKLIHELLEDDSKAATVYHDIQSIKEDDVVVSMVETLGKGALECSHLPVVGNSGHPGRLCIKRTNVVSPEEVAAEGDLKTTDDKDEGDATEKIGKASTGEENLLTSDDTPLQSLSNSRHGRRKKKHPKAKDIKSVRFDKHCLSELGDIPPGKGDVVLCDITQSRRTGAVQLSNLRVIERSEAAGEEGDGEAGDKASGVGIVTEVVAASKFGFITLLDENASRREILFFQLSSIVSDTPGNECRRGRDASLISKGDEVEFDIGVGKKGKRTAVNVRVLPRGSLNIPSKADKNACRGLVLMEPSHTTLSNTPARQASRSPAAKGNGRWDNVGSETSKGVSGSSVKEQGCILLVHDPTNMFSFRKVSKEKAEEEDAADTKADAPEGPNKEESSTAGKNDVPTKSVEFESAIGTHVSFKNGAVAIHGSGASCIADGSKGGPRRGDLVSFVKARSGKGVRDVRVVTRGAATLQRGRLENIRPSGKDDPSSPGTASFVAATEKEEQYEIDLSEVVSCDVSILKEKASVEGILHDGKIFGVCRTCDLYLDSKLGSSGHKERPKLNLTVRKELKNLGGKIMAQSMMAKGPDGTNGFAPGWTTRVSQYATTTAEDAKDSDEGELTKAEQE